MNKERKVVFCGGSFSRLLCIIRSMEGKGNLEKGETSGEKRGPVVQVR